MQHGHTHTGTSGRQQQQAVLLSFIVHRMLNGTCTEFGSETPLSERQSQTSHRKPGFMKYEIHSTCTVEGMLPWTSKSSMLRASVCYQDTA